MTTNRPTIAPDPAGAALRDRIRRAICEAEGFMWNEELLEPDEYGDVADAVLAVLPPPAVRGALHCIAEAALAAVEAALGDTLVPAAREEALAGIVAVLPPPTDRAAIYRQLATSYERIVAAALPGDKPDWYEAIADVARGLRRMADEAPARSDVGTEFVQQADQPDEAGIEVWETDLASADNPTPLRWGLDDVLHGDDDTTTILLSGPDGAPYWLELEPERAAALRDALTGPGGEVTEQQPRRGDAFERWLKAQRDEHRDTGRGVWTTLDNLLDLYRLHADTGTPLDEHVCEGRAVGGCECLEQPAAGAQP